MLTNRLGRLVLSALTLGWASTALAVPIRYDFSGEILGNYTGGYAHPWDGASTFSGSFVYDTDLPIDARMAPYPGFTYYTMGPSPSSGTVSSLTFQLGDLPSSYFGTPVDGRISVARTADDDSFQIQEIYPGSGSALLYATLGFGNDNRVLPAPLTSDAPPSGLGLPDFSRGATLSLYGLDADGRPVSINGKVTSLTPAGGTPGNPSGGDDAPHVPEPASVLVFAAVGAAFVLQARGRGRTA